MLRSVVITIKYSSNVVALAITAAQAIIDFENSNPDVGWGPNKLSALNKVKERSGVSFNIERVLKEWESLERQHRARKYF